MNEARDDEREAWTPSTEQVRSHYVFNQTNSWSLERGKAFDRWLAEHDAALRARKHPEPEITDEMVERAAMALTGLRKSQWEEARAEAAGGTDYYIDAARTALVAALWVPAGEGETR